MYNLLKIFIAIFVVHVLYNLINYLRFNHIETLLIGNYTDNTDLKIKAKTHKNEIVNYIKNSGIKDKYIPYAQPIGFGQISSGTVSVLENILNPSQDIALTVADMLLEAKGNYWSRFKNSFNPFYWLKIIVFIPKYLFSYLGMSSNNILIKIIQLIYWAIGISFTVLISVFPDEVKTFILSFINFS
ncbi:MAG: hypothetical protein HFJ47_01615 [Clostridia bacterium]|nr:hypothetical protein [Clostridia bacterium]